MEVLDDIRAAELERNKSFYKLNYVDIDKAANKFGLGPSEVYAVAGFMRTFHWDADDAAAVVDQCKRRVEGYVDEEVNKRMDKWYSPNLLQGYLLILTGAVLACGALRRRLRRKVR